MLVTQTAQDTIEQRELNNNTNTIGDTGQSTIWYRFVPTGPGTLATS